eukprot:jgi/Botrbrau1/8717/Bobra.0311s0027.1
MPTKSWTGCRKSPTVGAAPDAGPTKKDVGSAGAAQRAVQEEEVSPYALVTPSNGGGPPGSPHWGGGVEVVPLAPGRATSPSISIPPSRSSSPENPTTEPPMPPSSLPPALPATVLPVSTSANMKGFIQPDSPASQSFAPTNVESLGGVSATADGSSDCTTTSPARASGDPAGLPHDAPRDACQVPAVARPAGLVPARNSIYYDCETPR